jgi:hypothetical protein
VRILFDQGTPAPLREVLPAHDITTAHERGWSRLKNGELLDAAIADAIVSCGPGAYVEVRIPR